MRHSPKLILATLLVAAAFLAGCGQSAKTSNFPLTIVPSTGSATFTDNFNPYQLSTADGGTFGFIYEPLMAINSIDSSKISPWLAKSYKWNADFTQLTFTLRNDVKWSDGKPFTSADVLYTFQTAITVNGADANGIKSYIKDVSAPDANTFVVDFNTTSPLQFFNIAGHTPIVPRHIFSTYSDPVKNTNTNPVGTGPLW